MPRYNIAPTQDVPAVVARRQGGGRQLRLFRWGLIPSWAKDPEIGNRLINARGETVAEKASFRGPLARRRCLILADGFYEWQKVRGGKQPHHIRMRDGSAFAMAGLWDHWTSPDGSEIESCTILTTTPNEMLEQIHNRMPVILSPKDYGLWLDPQVRPSPAMHALLRPFPAEEMEARAVSKFVNNPGNDSQECIRPLD